MPEEQISPVPIPAALDDITPTWLTAALHSGDFLLTGKVTGVAATIIGEERGFTGVVARLRLTYSESTPSSAPATLIAKLPLADRPSGSSYRDRQQNDPAAWRRYIEHCAHEVRFYQEIVPAGAAPAPACYFSAVDEAAGPIVLLLEDLGTARPGDVLTGATPDQIASMLEAIAPFHARWWHQGRSEFTWLPPWIGDYDERQERYRRRIAPFLARYGGQLPPSIVAIVERLGDRYAAVLSVLDRAPATIIHADLHLDNVMFATPTPATAVILDWQSAARGPAAIDVGPFIAGSLLVEQQNETKVLLGHYHQLLTGHGVPNYSMSQLQHDYRLALLRQLAGVVGWLAQVDPATLEDRERALVAAALGDGRLITALQAANVA